MPDSENATDTKAHRLIEAIEQVGDDVWRIEIWADALASFASPVPVYETGNWTRAWLPRRCPQNG